MKSLHSTVIAATVALASLGCDGTLDSKQSTDAELVEALMSMTPNTTRAGHLRFAHPMLHRPEAAAVVLERLSAESSPQVRAALVDALPRTGGDYAQALLDLFTAEASPEVRAVAMSSVSRLDDDAASEILRTGLADSNAMVRQQAALWIANSPRGAHLLGTLVDTMTDQEPIVRSSAARTLGVLGDEAALISLADALNSDTHESVQLESLRAMSRIDLAFAKDALSRKTFREGTDPRLVKLASAIANR